MLKYQNFEIVKYSEKYKIKVCEVWEKSVLATHDFLSNEDFQSLKELVESIDFNELEVHCMVKGDDVSGFIGVKGKKVEMLFINPDLRGLGMGKKLMDFVFERYKIDKVDVNEQNFNAIRFYKRYGFEVYARSEKDEQGKNYPILKMSLNKSILP